MIGLKLICGDIEQYLKSKVQRKKKYEEKLKLGSGATKNWASSADQSHQPCDLCCIREKTVKSVDNLVIDYSLTINMENVNQHATQWIIVYADKVAVLNTDLS